METAVLDKPEGTDGAVVSFEVTDNKTSNWSSTANIIVVKELKNSVQIRNTAVIFLTDTFIFNELIVLLWR